VNRQIRQLGATTLGMVVLLLVNLTYVQVVEGPALATDPRNVRALSAALSRPRGQISAGGRLLARSVTTPDSLRSLRQYPGGSAYAAVTGYFSPVYGLTGLESASGGLLDGTDPSLLLHRISGLFGPPAQSVGNIVTTIVPAVQEIAYRDLTSRGYTGSVVAMDPATGAILALASAPSLDPNMLTSHDLAQERSAWSAAGAASPSPLIDRAVDQTYPPGSTFKLVDLSAALQQGVTPDTPVTSAPRITLPGTTTTLENYAGEHCGPGTAATVPLATALAYSCNTAFATLTDQIGGDALRSAAQQYGIGSDQQIPLPVTASHLGPLSDAASLAQSGIGQRDVRLTPLQNAEIVATLANGGVRMAPYLVREVDAVNLSVLSRTSPHELGRAVPLDVAAMITQMMVGSERLTTGHGSVSGVTIASKTGTAEHGIDPKATPPHTWYSAFAPADHPRVAVSVLVENGGHLGDAATGASVAAPIGRDVIAAALGGGS
jgi:penicillin-binding protein A